MADLVDEILGLFSAYGGGTYDEDVTMTEHCVQTAALALGSGATDSLVAAALLHDLGHLLLARERGDENYLAHDWEHETRAADWLRPHFGAAVADTVGLHVSAKRWLCAVDETYATSLSSASVASLAIQGGPFDQLQCADFESLPAAADAVSLRRWDDDGKVPGSSIPPLDEFSELLRSLVL